MKQPIGIFDSGVGGLSVLRHLERLLPHENFIYFADSGHFPYGSKTQEELKKRSMDIAAFLVAQNVKLIIIACHTASANALEHLQKRVPVPVIGTIDPTVTTLKSLPLSGDLILLGTEATFRSGIFQKELPHLTLIPMIQPSLIQKIEHHDHQIDLELKTVLNPLKDTPALLLASTHYSLIAQKIEQQLPKTRVIDPSFAVARHVALLLKDPIENQLASHQFYVSGNFSTFEQFLNTIPFQRKLDLLRN